MNDVWQNKGKGTICSNGRVFGSVSSFYPLSLFVDLYNNNNYRPIKHINSCLNHGYTECIEIGRDKFH